MVVHGQHYAPLFYFKEQSTRCLLDRRLPGPKRRSERYRYTKSLAPAGTTILAPRSSSLQPTRHTEWSVPTRLCFVTHSTKRSSVKIFHFRPRMNCSQNPFSVFGDEKCFPILVFAVRTFCKGLLKKSWIMCRYSPSWLCLLISSATSYSAHLLQCTRAEASRFHLLPRRYFIHQKSSVHKEPRQSLDGLDNINSTS
jgi:hypothetical protein